MTFIHGGDIEGIIVAQKEAEGFWLSPDLMLARPMKKKGEDQRDSDVPSGEGGSLFRATGHR